MASVLFNKKLYECSRAVKGVDYIRLYDEKNNVIVAFAGISDFSAFTLQEGEWEDGMSNDIVGASAKLVNTSIQLTLIKSACVETGLIITFKAPCNCTEANNITIGENVFNMVDTFGEPVMANIEAFKSGAIVSIILNLENHNAYIQNPGAAVAIADTITHTLKPSGWSNSKYSLNTLYSSSSYDIFVALNGSMATVKQKEAFDNAEIIGTNTNELRAYGEIPAIDIPIIIRAVKK